MGEELPEEILATIDEKIKDIIVELNTLFFIKKTWFSCQGHPGTPAVPYIDIEFDVRPEYVRIIEKFRKKLLKIEGSVGREFLLKGIRYHYAYDWRTKEEITKGWGEFRVVIEDFKKIPPPEYSN